MAIVQYIPESRQNPSAQKAVIDYCCQPYKTQPDERTEYISGINCAKYKMDDYITVRLNISHPN